MLPLIHPHIGESISAQLRPSTRMNRPVVFAQVPFGSDPMIGVLRPGALLIAAFLESPVLTTRYSPPLTFSSS